MSTAVRAAVRLRYPEFTGVADASLDAYETDAMSFVDPTVFATNYVEALANATAHIGTLALRSSNGGSSSVLPGTVSTGAVTSVKTMRLAATYATTASSGAVGSEAWWKQTPPGATFWAMLNTRAGVMPFVAVP